MPIKIDYTPVRGVSALARASGEAIGSERERSRQFQRSHNIEMARLQSLIGYETDVRRQQFNLETMEKQHSQQRRLMRYGSQLQMRDYEDKLELDQEVWDTRQDFLKDWDLQKLALGKQFSFEQAALDQAFKLDLQRQKLSADFWKQEQDQQQAAAKQQAQVEAIDTAVQEGTINQAEAQRMQLQLQTGSKKADVPPVQNPQDAIRNYGEQMRRLDPALEQMYYQGVQGGQQEQQRFLQARDQAVQNYEQQQQQIPQQRAMAETKKAVEYAQSQGVPQGVIRQGPKKIQEWYKLAPQEQEFYRRQWADYGAEQKGREQAIQKGAETQGLLEQARNANTEPEQKAFLHRLGISPTDRAKEVAKEAHTAAADYDKYRARLNQYQPWKGKMYIGTSKEPLTKEQDQGYDDLLRQVDYSRKRWEFAMAELKQLGQEVQGGETQTAGERVTIYKEGKPFTVPRPQLDDALKQGYTM